MAPSYAALSVIGLALWGLSFARPGWTWRSLRWLRWRWLAALAFAAGLLLIVMADMRAGPALLRSPAVAPLWLTAPGLLARVLLTVFVVLPPVLDLWGDGGSRRALTMMRGSLMGAALRAYAPVAALISMAPGFSILQSTGGGSVDAGLPALLYWGTSAASLGAFLGGAVARRMLAPHPKTAHLYCWNTALGVGLLGAIVMAVATHLALTLAPWVWWLSVAAWVAASRAWFRRRELPAYVTAVLLLGAALLAFQFRWQYLHDLPGNGLPMSLDGQSYFDEALMIDWWLRDPRATRASLLLSGVTWFREPFFIFLMQAWLEALGPNPQFAIYLTVVASVAVVVLGGVAITALLGPWVGVGTSYLLAMDSLWIRNAATGLREEVTGALLLMAVALWWLRAARERGLSWLAPMAAAGAVLTRADALPFSVAVLVWTAVAQRWRPVRALAMIAILAAVLVPIFGAYVRKTGEAFPASVVVATANWREEFADRMGQPGYEWERRITAAEYLFHYHSPLELALFTVRGVARIYTRELFDSLYYWHAGGAARIFGNAATAIGLQSRALVPGLFFCGVLGLLALWRRWRTHWLPLALCLAGVAPPIGFIAGIDKETLYQGRYAYMAAPYANAVLAWVACSSVRLVYRWVSRQATRNPAKRDPASPAAASPAVRHQ